MTLCLRSRVALFATVFLACVSFSIVMPTIWPYLSSIHGTTSYLAYVVAIYSIGEALGALLFGALTPYFSTSASSATAAGIGILGSLLYISAQRFPTFGRHFILVGRFLHGIWTGAAQAIQQVYLADVLEVDKLSSTTVTMSGYANLGFVFGPTFALIASLLPRFDTMFGLSFTELTSPGYVVLMCGVINLWLFLYVLNEEHDRFNAPITTSDSIASTEHHYAVDSELESLLSNAESNDYRYSRQSIGSLMPVLLICNVICFAHFYGFAVQETATTPFVQSLFNWSIEEANALFTVAGLVSLAGVAFMVIGTKFLSDRILVLFSLILGMCGYGLLLGGGGHLSQSRFLSGFLLISLAFPVGRAAILSLYTKVLPQKSQGVGQGIILAVGAVARIVGPFWAVRAISSMSGAMLVFGCTALSFAVCAAFVISWYSKLATIGPGSQMY